MKMRSSSARYSKFLRNILDIAFPPECVICGYDLLPESSENWICRDCEAGLPASEAFCERCSAPVGPLLNTSKGCRHCRRDRFAFQAVIAAAEYRDQLREGVLKAKHRGGIATAVWLADLIWERRAADLRQFAADFVVPIPQHWAKRIIKSHNPPELMARRLASRLKVRFHRHILTKTRRTPAQASLIPSMRRANLRNAFISTRPLEGCRVLLVDDVLTTGTTADQATRALREAGAAAVVVAVAARGIGV